MISVNDRSYPFQSGMCLMDALKEDNVDIHGATLITLNGTLVKRECYPETALNDGDEILVIRVSSGG